MEIYCVSPSEKVLSEAELSLKAVHVGALAIRGIFVQVLNNYRDKKVEIATGRGGCAWKRNYFERKISCHFGNGNVLAGGKMNKIVSDRYAAKFETKEAQETAVPAPRTDIVAEGDWIRRK